MYPVKASASTFGQTNPAGREWLARAVVGAALVTVAAGALAPAEVWAHAGEVHSDAPEAAAPASNTGGSSDRAQAGAYDGKVAPPGDSSGVRSEERGEEGATAAPVPAPPPAPEEPESDPLLHFAALGVAVVAGLGLLLVRRRRFEA
jgi:hypothetical protein